MHEQICEAELEELLPRACCIYAREFVREKKYKTEAEAFGWSFVFEDFVSEELKKKVTQKLEVNLNPVMSLVLLFPLRSSCLCRAWLFSEDFLQSGVVLLLKLSSIELGLTHVLLCFHAL